MTASSFIDFYKRVDSSKWLEWVFRVSFSLVFFNTVAVLPGTEGSSLDLCWLLIFIAIWCYFFRLKVLGLIPLILCALIHYWNNQVYS
jgi:hypothetical protein